MPKNKWCAGWLAALAMAVLAGYGCGGPSGTAPSSSAPASAASTSPASTEAPAGEGLDILTVLSVEREVDVLAQRDGVAVLHLAVAGAADDHEARRLAELRGPLLDHAARTTPQSSAPALGTGPRSGPVQVGPWVAGRGDCL